MKYIGLGLLLIILVVGLAEASPTNVNIKLPFFLYAYNNLQTITFDFRDDITGDASGLAGQAKGAKISGKEIKFATLSNLDTCIKDLLEPIDNLELEESGNIGANAEARGSTEETDLCYFAPSDVTRYKTFSVKAENDADGWLLVITNSANWNVNANVTTAFQTLKNANLHVTANKNTSFVELEGGTIKDSYDLADQKAFYYTDRRLHYVLPLNYALEINPFDSSVEFLEGDIFEVGSGSNSTSNAVVTADRAQITYTFAIP